MKIKSLFVAVLLAAGVVVAPANAADDSYEFPVITSFTVSPKEIDVAASNPTLTFTLDVTHNIGISTTVTNLRFSDSVSNVQLITKLTRTDSPVDTKLKKVTFKGTLVLPNSLAPGLYSFYAEPITGIAPAGKAAAPKTGNIYPAKFNDFVDGETSVIVRSNGELNLDFQTFVGPSYPSTLSVSDNKPRTLFTSEPTWKVGETYKADDFFEKRSPLVTLQISTSTPLVCSSDGKMLKFLTTGNCSFTVFTAKSKEYLYKKLDLNATITEARRIQTLLVPQISNQTTVDLPKVITIPSAYTAMGNLVLATTTTPTICAPTINSVKIMSGGKCVLKYQTDADATYAASDVYTVTFDISKDGLPIVEPTPVVTPTPVATPTPTAKPVVKKTITCVKGKKTVKKTAVSPKCPAGYNLKK
jgi:hypothetical protein